MTAATRIGFVIEQALGHLTHAQQLRESLQAVGEVSPQWMMIPYRAGDIWDKIAGLPFSMRLSLRARYAVRQTLRRQPLDCLYFHTQNLSLFSLGFMRRIPSVISLDATPANFELIAAAYGSMPSGGLAGRLKSGWFRKVFSLARGLVAMSDWAKTSLVTDYAVDPDKIRIIPFSVNLQKWPFVPRRAATGRRLRLLFVGGDFERKGGRHLIEAFERGLADSCELDIVTREPVPSSSDHLRVHSGMTPNSAALKQLYAEADLFVMPTLGDATPIAVLEAMASGLPVITTNVGAIGEMIEDGVSGYFVQPGDPRAIVQVITSLVSRRDALAAVARAARAVVERDFNAETNSQRLLDFLREVSGRPPAGSARQ